MIVEKSCCPLHQMTVPISARPKGHRWEKKAPVPSWKRVKEAIPVQGVTENPVSNRVEGEDYGAYSTTRPLYVLKGHKTREIRVLACTNFRILFAVRNGSCYLPWRVAFTFTVPPSLA